MFDWLRRLFGRPVRTVRYTAITSEMVRQAMEYSE